VPCVAEMSSSTTESQASKLEPGRGARGWTRGNRDRALKQSRVGQLVALLEVAIAPTPLTSDESIA
jgi:hypothetical protein